LIAEILYKSKEIERWGSGLKRIYEERMADNVKVEFKTGMGRRHYGRDDQDIQDISNLGSDPVQENPPYGRIYLEYIFLQNIYNEKKLKIWISTLHLIIISQNLCLKIKLATNPQNLQLHHSNVSTSTSS